MEDSATVTEGFSRGVFVRYIQEKHFFLLSLFPGQPCFLLFQMWRLCAIALKVSQSLRCREPPDAL